MLTVALQYYVKRTKKTYTHINVHKHIRCVLRFEESFKANTLLLSRNFSRRRSQQRFRYLYCIQINSPATIDICLIYLLSVELSADLVFPHVSWKPLSSGCVMSLGKLDCDWWLPGRVLMALTKSLSSLDDQPDGKAVIEHFQRNQ